MEGLNEVSIGRVQGGMAGGKRRGRGSSGRRWGRRRSRG